MYPMSEYPLEPGLLRVFRLFIVSRMGVILLGAVVFLEMIGPDPAGLAALAACFLADLVFLLVMLCWSWLQQQLGRWHLRMALVIVTLMQIVEIRYFADVYGVQRPWGFWLIFPFLSVPLILTAWQYSYRQVALFSLGVMLVELLITPSSSPWRTEQLSSSLGVLMGRSIVFMLIGYIITHLMEEQREQRRRLAEANAKLIEYAAALEDLAITRERNRLARELHDTLAHTLSGLAVQLDAIAALWPTFPERAREMLDRALITTRRGLDETRRALQDLRAGPLETLGLAQAVRDLAESAAKRGGFILQHEIAESLDGLNENAEQALYRIAQEALENVIQHANATAVTVVLRREGERIVLIVSDNGRGLAPEAIEEGRLGLRGMEERARLIGGSFGVRGRSEGGAEVRAEAPLQ